MTIERLMIRPEWMDLAACRGYPAEMFYAEKAGGGPTLDEGRKVCRRCPVQGECLDYALEFSERIGLWGGLTEKERRKVKAERRAS